MCGIFGFSHFRKDEQEIARASLHTLFLRGPDSWGEWFNDDCYFGHRRLSILDLSPAGAQPMVNKDSSVVIVCNGEIYNYKQLRSELIRDYEFKSESDSEVLLHGYSEWGIEELLKRLDGMYAFAIYDFKKQMIYLGRDRIGIKPLYWSDKGQRLSWSSELKALVRLHGKTNLKIDSTAIFDYYNYLYIPSPKTIYHQVYKLEPGHFIEYDINRHHVQLKKYWDLKNELLMANKEIFKMPVEELIKASVKSHLQSDVPLGVFISGGLDSSIVATSIRQLTDQSLKGFTIDIPGSEQDQYLSKLMCDHLHIQQVREPFEESDLHSSRHQMASFFDEPFADTSCFPMYRVSKLAFNSGVKVVLSGDGGDELFYGYNWYKRAERGFFQPRWYRKFVKDLLQSKGRNWNQSSHMDLLVRYQEWLGGPGLALKNSLARKLEIPGDYDPAWFFRKHDRPDLDQSSRWRWLDLHCYLPEDILTKVDRTTMACSIEARVPLLDKNLVLHAFSLSEKELKSAEGLKIYLKKAYSNLLPEEVLKQQKKGFSIPVNKWGTFGQNQPKQIGIFDSEFASHL